MKTLSIFIISIFLLFSCSDNKEGVIKETGQIINDYADTLEGSIQDSKEVKNLIEINQDKLQDSINSIR